MFDFKEAITEELKNIQAAGTYKKEMVIYGRQDAEIDVGGKKLLNFCANNYLGLSGKKEIAEMAKRALDEHGFGMSSVRFICGTSTVHKELEAEISKFFGMEDAILYTSCFDANTGFFETIFGEGDAIFSDELNHASVIDGVRLSKAERFRFKHSDMADLETQLKGAHDRRRKVIATDGVFSMDGEVANLRKICDLADTYHALVMVDDSHGSGVLGNRGRGSIEAAGVMDSIDILTSTFGKALGGASGGFTTGKKEIIEYLRQRSRPYLFSNTLPIAIAAVALSVLRGFETSFLPLRETLISNTEYFRKAMQKLGFSLGGDPPKDGQVSLHPITPVMLMDENLTMQVADALFKEGIYVRGFTYPVVPKGKARIRVQLSAAHTREHLDRALSAFAVVGKNFKIIS